jgi:VanZ family protein
MLAKMEIAFWRCLALLGIGLDFLSSSMPGSSVGIPEPWDKAVHGSAYACLSFVLCLGSGRFRRHAVWAVPVAVALYGGLDEWHQSFVAGRSCDIRDWYADLAGASLAAFGWWRARNQA